MKWLDVYRIRLLLVGVFAAIALGGGSANADFVFGKPQNLGPVINSPSGDIMGCFSADSLELYFSSNRPGGYGYYDIYMTTRATKSDPWGPPLNLGPAVNTQVAEICSSISSDGLTLYISEDWDWSPRPGGLGGCDIWMARRASRGAQWGTPVNVGAPINTSAGEIGPKISGDELILVFASDRAGGQGSYDLWMSTRATIQDDWGAPVNIGGIVNSGSFDHSPILSSDERALVFTSNRLGGFGGYDLWMTTRKTHSDPWGPPVNLGPRINSWGHEDAASISADGRMLYFLAHTPPGGFGGYDLWEAPIIPIVDFNGDGIVDLKDFSRLAQYWGQDKSSVDMGPMSWGDGRVDIQDVPVFAEHWLTEVLPVDLVAYWKLDEAEGGIAHDSAAGKDGTLHSEPIWQSTGGKIAGALEFDGIDNYVSTPFILDPAAGAFSVFAWVKNGGAEQAIISQAGGVNWLAAGTSQGKLMTELKAPGRYGTPLFSEAVIIDGEWHQVGLTWDGTNRILYVDGVEVAKGAQGTLAGSTGGLYIGAGKSLEPGSFWSGLIDDIKIYDRALTP